MASSSGSVRHTLVRLHAWTGLILFVWITLITLTGTLLGFKVPWYRSTVPHANAEWVQRTDVQLADQMARIEAAFPGQVRSVLLASPDVMVDDVRLMDGGGAWVHPLTGAIIEQWGEYGRLMDVLLSLHHALLLGQVGEIIVLVLALALTALIVVGFYLWWPYRMKLMMGIPWVMASRADLIAGHRDWGLILGIPFAFMAVTGLAMNWPGGGALKQPGAEGVARLPAPHRGPIAWAPTIEGARAAFPKSALRVVQWPTPKGDPLRIRIKQRDEWHPNGRTRVDVDPATGAVLARIDALALGRSSRLNNALYPLHAGYAFGPHHIGLVRILGCLFLLFSLWGVIAYARLLLKQRRKRLSRLRPATP
jgi:uncharacterized iron-regulated membrane protein